MERLSNKMTEDNRRMEQIDEELDRRMAKYDTPEKNRYMQIQIKAAIFSLAHLFSIEDEELGHIVMPEFAFCHFHDSYNPEINEICMDPERMTPYRISSVAGKFLYYTINPEIFHQQHKFNLAFTRSLGQSNPSPSRERDFVLSRAYTNLIVAVSHYRGLFFCQDGCFESDNSSDLFEILNSLPEDSDEYRLALIDIGTHYRGMMIAECLFSRYPTEKFKPIIRLSFEEARARLFYMTGVELLDMDS